MKLLHAVVKHDNYFILVPIYQVHRTTVQIDALRAGSFVLFLAQYRCRMKRNRIESRSPAQLQCRDCTVSASEDWRTSSADDAADHMFVSLVMTTRQVSRHLAILLLSSHLTAALVHTNKKERKSIYIAPFCPRVHKELRHGSHSFTCK